MNESLAQKKTGFIRRLMVVAGLLIVIAGLLTFVLPIPIGLPLLAIGLLILIRHSQIARYAVIKAARRHRGLRRLLRRLRLLTPESTHLQTASEKARR